MRNFIQITITKKGENRARLGHPWVFEGEVLKESEKPENGSLVDVVSEKGKYIGTGFYNDHSKIRVRILSYNAMTALTRPFLSAASAMRWSTARPSCPVRILPAAA